MSFVPNRPKESYMPAPEYYTNTKEHVMTYEVWKTLKPKDVARLIGPLAKDVK